MRCNLIDVEPDPEAIRFGMPVEMTTGVSQQDKQGNDVVAFYFRPARARLKEELMAADVFVAGVGMLKFGRYPDKDVPELGGEAALLALDDAGLGIRDVRDAGRRLPLPGERHGRPAHPAGDRPDGHPGDERRQRVRHRVDGVPRGVAAASRRASATSRSPSASSRWARWGCSAAAAAPASAPRA